MENAASRFGQRLAHTEKKYRDQALKKLTLYLGKRSEWSDLEWDKLWKALFYCMWMSDKRPIQDELSTSLASLIHAIPQPELALAFIHSFFRTMHREWHGIDGLRLDKFYSLIRKFVHQSIVLLQRHDWEPNHVQAFVTILSSEIMSQVPNGLRLHVSDLFLTELHGAAAESVDTESFLVLLEPFFTLLSSEYDKTVFKRVRELVFLPLLTTYKFGEQPPRTATKKSDSDVTDEEDVEEEDEKVFELVELVEIQHRIFAIASADDTAERNRSVLYDLYSKFFQETKVDSLKASQEPATSKNAKVTKKKPVKVESAKKKEATEDTEDKKKSKKNKKRKKSKHGEGEEQAETTDADVAMEDAKVEEVAPPATKKSKKAKKAKEEEKTIIEEEVKVVKKDKKNKQEKTEKKKTSVVVEQEEMSVEPKKAKKEKKNKKTEVVQEEEVKVVVEKTEEVSKKTKKSEKKAKLVEEEAEGAAANSETPKKSPPTVKTVIRSGKKFRRCVVCNGYGKGLVPAGKDSCRHCERVTAQKKKKVTVDKKKNKKRKAEDAVEAASSSASSSKKVTFGKNKALAHDLSVKRLRASATKEAVPKEDASIKSALKVAATPKKSTSGKKTRMKAADFF